VVSNSLATSWTILFMGLNRTLGSLSMGFPRQEYWNRLPFPFPGDLSDPEIEIKLALYEHLHELSDNISILQMRKLRHAEVKWLEQGYTASTWRGRNMNPDYLSSQSPYRAASSHSKTCPSHRESLVWMLLSQFDTWAKLTDTVTQTQKKRS